MQLVTTILKLLPLGIVAVGGLFFIKAANFHPFNSSGFSAFGAIGASAAITMYSFTGIECATIPAGSVQDAEKTIPRATMIGLVVTTLVYLLGSISIMGIIPQKALLHSLTPYADAAAIMFGSRARYWASAGMAIAAFGALNGWTLVQGQVPLAIANDKLFPAIFGRQNKSGAPYFGIIFSSALVTLFMMMNYTKGLAEQFKFLILLATLSVLVPYLFCAAAYVIIRFDKARLHSGGWAPALLVGAMAFAYSLWAVAGTGESSVYWGFLLLLAGIPFYVWVVFKKNDVHGS